MKAKKEEDQFVLDTRRARELHMSYGQYQAYKYTHSSTEPAVQITPDYLQGTATEEPISVKIPVYNRKQSDQELPPYEVETPNIFDE